MWLGINWLHVVQMKWGARSGNSPGEYVQVPEDDVYAIVSRHSRIHKQHTQTEEQRNLFERWKQGEFTIVPEDNPFIDAWDIILLCALSVTAVVLPFEVALCPEPNHYLSVMNSCINYIFVVDIILNFNMAYENPLCSSEMDLYVREPLRVARNYMAVPLSDKLRAGWFWPDSITVIPWEHAPFLPSSGQWTRLVRVLKLARMFRLVRVLKLFNRWHTHFGFSFASVEIVKCVLVTLMTVHWLACFWSYFGVNPKEGSFNWLRQIAENTGSHLIEEGQLHEDTNPLLIYNVALYWATMTLTTVGYGDVIPESQSEVVMVTVSMILSSFIWSYVLGSVVNVITNSDVFHSQFTQTMDDLNSLMESRLFSSLCGCVCESTCMRHTQHIGNVISEAQSAGCLLAYKVRLPCNQVLTKYVHASGTLKKYIERSL